MKRYQVFSNDDDELVHLDDMEEDSMPNVLDSINRLGVVDTDYIIIDMKTAMTCQVIKDLSEITDFNFSGKDIRT